MDHALWGPGYSDRALAALLAARSDYLAGGGCRVRRPADDGKRCCGETAAAVAGGQVVGWFQGRMEWGARGRSAPARSCATPAAAI